MLYAIWRAKRDGVQRHHLQSGFLVQGPERARLHSESLSAGFGRASG